MITVVMGIMEMPRVAADVITESNNSCFYLMPNQTHLPHYLAIQILQTCNANACVCLHETMTFSAKIFVGKKKKL